MVSYVVAGWAIGLSIMLSRAFNLVCPSLHFSSHDFKFFRQTQKKKKKIQVHKKKKKKKKNSTGW
jgi:hypothetical protein